MGGNFHEKLNKVPRIKFCGFKFRGTTGGNMNFNLNTCAIDVSTSAAGRACGYHVHEDIWKASQCENSICSDSFTVAAAFRSK